MRPLLSLPSLPILLFFLFFLSLSHSCHYSCSSCGSDDYYNCTSCQPNRGQNRAPVYGMCYCDNDSDQDQQGVCRNSGEYNQKSKILIVMFIGLTIGLAAIAVIVKGIKYYLYKTIQDVQQLSLIVFFNMYFPQQFDIFLTTLYRFNISSYTFANLAEGSLYVVMPDSSVASVDGQNIYGKYRLLKKTANFFGNQFTWIIVFASIMFAAVLIRIWRNWLKKRRDFQLIKRQVQGPSKPLEQSHAQLNQSVVSEHWVSVQRVEVDKDKITLYWFVNKIYNMVWFNLLIVFFYFSIIEININIFTQIANLTFSSSFATTGAFFSAIFLALQIVLLFLLFLKAKQQMIKPQWMRDYSFTPTIYLIRTNFKTVTKYFWFISCFKKILLAMMITVFYKTPLTAIVAVCAVHSLYLGLAVYCEPFERRYIRAHFYITQGAKLFLFLSLINFTAKYSSTVQLINLTIIFYVLLAFLFGMHFFFLVVSIMMERQVYRHFLYRKFCKDQHPELKIEKVGYRAQEKVFIYVKE